MNPRTIAYSVVVTFVILKVIDVQRNYEQTFKIIKVKF